MHTPIYTFARDAGFSSIDELSKAILKQVGGTMTHRSMSIYLANMTGRTARWWTFGKGLSRGYTKALLKLAPKSKTLLDEVKKGCKRELRDEKHLLLTIPNLPCGCTPLMQTMTGKVVCKCDVVWTLGWTQVGSIKELNPN